MPDVLEEIVEKKRARLADQKTRLPLNELRRKTAARTKGPSFSAALRPVTGVAVIAEVKQASPSAGLIRKESDLARRLQSYVRGGAVALSILTEEDYFQGSPSVLELARRETTLPLLRKDFIVDPYQILESAGMGADALLLITTLLEKSVLKDMITQTAAAGLEALVETHDEKDLEKALQSGATLIGINHRNLRTLEMDMQTAIRLLPLVPSGITVVVESGITEPAQAAKFRALGAHAILIGETLMRDPDPESLVRRFVYAKGEV